MKILHISLGCFYFDNYSYQENLLPKYHKLLGYDVKIITGLYNFDQNGQESDYEEPISYCNENGITVCRLAYKFPSAVNKKLKKFVGLYDAIKEYDPDILFIHGCQFLDLLTVRRFIQNSKKKIVCYIDNHADKKNSGKNWLSYYVLHKCIWKYCVNRIEPFVSKFYGVLPVRVDYLVDTYNLPESKCQLLPLGADDILIKETLHLQKRIDNNGFVIVTGGKIDKNKPQTLLLMEAANKLSGIKLLVFGSVDDEYKAKFESLLNDSVIYMGWKEPREIYEVFYNADLVCFPGLHSVLWEQAVGLGKPCIFKELDGCRHVDLGGNCLFFYEDTVDCYVEIINEALENIETMSRIAKEKGPLFFSYSAIAKESLNEMNEVK